MSKSQVSILNFKVLYNILFEIKDILKFEILNFETEDELIKKNKENNSIIITKKKPFNKNIVSIGAKSLLVCAIAFSNSKSAGFRNPLSINSLFIKSDLRTI